MNCISDKRVISRIFKELLQLKINQIIQLKMDKGLDISHTHTQKDIQMANKHMKDVQHHQPLGKCKSKPHEKPLHTY